MHLGPDGPLVVGAQTCLFLDIRPHDPALETFSGGNFASAHPVSVEVAHTGEAGVAPFVIGVTAVPAAISMPSTRRPASGSKATVRLGDC